MATLSFEIIGRTWSGALAARPYDDHRAPEEPCSPEEGRRIRDAVIAGQRGQGIPDMGDFASVEDCRVIHVRTHAQNLGRTRRHMTDVTTLAGFRDPNNRKRFERWTYGR